ncbi:MAG: hypothetical protein J6J00_03460 [Treponema sp.]|nr:hypothetical protein [Treponema sp.]
MFADSDFEEMTMSFSYDDDFDDYEEDFDDDFDDYEEDDEALDDFDDVFKEEDIDEPYDDVEEEDGYGRYKSGFDDEE